MFAKLKYEGQRYNLYIMGSSLDTIPSATYPWDITKLKLSLSNCEDMFKNEESDEVIVKIKTKWSPKTTYCELCGDGGKYLSTPCDHNDGTCPNWVPSIKDRMLTLEKI